MWQELAHRAQVVDMQELVEIICPAVDVWWGVRYEEARTKRLHMGDPALFL